MADTMTSPATEAGNESLDDDNGRGDVLFPDHWLCCAVCGGGLPLFCKCLAVPDAGSETELSLDSRVSRLSAVQF